MEVDKIALINPPSPFLIDERVFPNLGLVQLATSMREKGVNAELFDLCGDKDPKRSMEEIAKNFEIFGFSSTSAQFRQTTILHDILKKINPNAYSIIGGAHASAVSSLRSMEENSEDPNITSLENFDMIYQGEGANLVEVLLHKNSDKWQRGPLVKKMEDVPIADRSLIDIKSYKYLIDGRPTTTVVTQRGCPFKCEFCSGRDIPMYSRVRSSSPQRVIEELDYLNDQFGFDAFMWFDDELNVNPRRLFGLAEELAKRDYIHRGFVRSDLLVKNPDTLNALVDAGFVELCSGVESGSKEVLERVGKGTTPEINSQAAQMIKDAGLRYKAFTIIGNPGETYEEVEKTKQWLRDAKPDGFDVSILTPYPGSKLYDMSVQSTKYPGFGWQYKGLYFNRKDFSQEDLFYKGKPGEYTAQIRTDELSSEDLVNIRDQMEKELKS